jgi:hypothetical protein
MKFELRPLTGADRAWVTQRIINSWGASVVIAHGTIYHPADLPGYMALAGDNHIGLLTYNIEDTTCEIITLESWREGHGVGMALIESVKQVARRKGCHRLYLVTTNDNTRALRFYQKRGFVIAAVRLNAVAGSRKVKPEIPMIGNDDIPIRDEIELEIWI